MGDPELLLMDEPAAGLDLGARERLLHRLASLAADQSVPPLVFVTHHLEEIPPGVTHAALLRRARLVAAGPVDRFSPVMRFRTPSRSTWPSSASEAASRPGGPVRRRCLTARVIPGRPPGRPGTPGSERGHRPVHRHRPDRRGPDVYLDVLVGPEWDVPGLPP